MEKKPLFKKRSETRMMWWWWTFPTTNALSQFTDYHSQRLNSRPDGSQSSLMAEEVLLISGGTGADAGRRQSASHLPSLFCLHLSLCNPRIFLPFHQRGLLFSWSTFKSPLPAEQLWHGSHGSESTLHETADANSGNYFIEVQGVVLVKTSFKHHLLHSKGNFSLPLNSLPLTLSTL